VLKATAYGNTVTEDESSYAYTMNGPSYFTFNLATGVCSWVGRLTTSVDGSNQFSGVTLTTQPMYMEVITRKRRAGI
jgi:hypothetical protein